MSTLPPPVAPSQIEQPRVRVREKLAYGAGGVAGALPNLGPIYFFEPVFVVALGLSPAWLASCGVLYRIWDAVTDALMGWISDNTRTRWGRRRPYIVMGAILTGLAMPLVWCFPEGWRPESLLGWMLAAQLLLIVATTIWNIPYQCLLMEVSADGAERTRVAAYRQYFGSAAWLALGWSWWLAQRPIFGDESGAPNILRGAFWLTVVAAVIVVVTGVLPALFCRERLYEATAGATAAKRPRTRLRDDMRRTFSHRAFLWLTAGTLFFWLGTQAKGGLAFYTRLYHVCGGDAELAAKLGGLEGTLSLGVGLACIPLFEWLARRRGKRAAMSVMLWLVLAASLSTLFTYTPAMPYLSLVSGVLLAPAQSAVWVLLPTMLGDVIDDDELRGGERRDGSFSSVFSWVFKLGQSLAVGLSGWLVTGAGFDPALKAAQPESVILTMRGLLAVFPTVCVVLGLLAFARFSLTPARIAANAAALAERRARAIENQA